jgi:hypothetical protein
VGSHSFYSVRPCLGPSSSLLLTAVAASPAWSTATLIVLSFGAGVVAAILIWKTSEATKVRPPLAPLPPRARTNERLVPQRKKEVTRRVWKMLKKDEAALEERRLAAVKLREETAAEEKEKKRREKGEKSVV